MAEDRRDEETAEAVEPQADQASPAASGEAGATSGEPAEVERDDAGDGGAGADPDPGRPPVEDELEQLRAELDTARDMTLRAQAEVQNAKRRAEQDVEKARKYALERFCSELLPVVDNLERALEAGGGEDEALRPITEGVELTLKSMRDALRKFHIEPVDPVGEPFDPQLHQAMSMVENPDAEPNTVLTVMQKGYTLHGRLVRPAMVIVSKAPAAQ